MGSAGPWGIGAIVGAVLTLAGTALAAQVSGAKLATIIAVVGILVTAALARTWGYLRDR